MLGTIGVVCDQYISTYGLRDHNMLTLTLSADRRRHGFVLSKFPHRTYRSEVVRYTMGGTVLNRPTTVKENNLGLTISADMKV